MSHFLSWTAQGLLPKVQFRLRSLVIGTSLVAAALAPVRAEIARCQAIQALCDQVSQCGGDTFFDYQLIEEGVVLRQLQSSQPGWIRGFVGAHVFSEVVEIHLDNARPNSTIFDRIGERCPKLLHLSLRAAAISDEALQSIAKCGALTYLDLGGANITDAGLLHFAEHQHLTTLGLENTKITGASFVTLARLKSLEIVVLDNSPIDDSDITHLADSGSIQMLFLAGTEISDDVIPHLARMPSLVSVSLGRTKVTPAGRQKLRQLRPEISQI